MDPKKRLEKKNAFDGSLAVGLREFNLKTGRDKHLNNTQEEWRKAVDPTTGRLKMELSRTRSCPVCGQDRGAEIFVKQGFPHLKCGNCSMVYVNPVLREDRLASFYQSEESWTEILMNRTQQDLDRKKFQYGLDLIEDRLDGKGLLLDIGCGPGLFLETARDRGWTILGLEFNEWCLNHMAEKGQDCLGVPLDQAGLPPDHCLCVTMWDVLEHIADPGSVLDGIGRVLVPGGILLIQVPNIEALVNRILHEKAGTFGGHSHLNFFSRDTLSRLLEDRGFEVLEAETLLTELGTINNHLSFEDPYFGSAGQVMELLTPDYIHRNFLGSRLLILAANNN